MFAVKRPTPRWPDPRVKPPFGSVEVDWGHPLATGLVDLWVFNEGAGFPSNLVKSANALRPNGAVKFTPIVSGQAVTLPGASGDFYDAAVPADTPYLGDITLTWRGIIRTGSAFRHFMGKHAGNGGSNNPFDYRTSPDSVPRPVLIRAASGGLDSFVAEELISLNTLHTLSVAASGVNGVAARFAVDAVVRGSINSSIEAPYTGSGANIRIGVRTDGAVIMDGLVELAAIRSRYYSDEFLRWLHAEPYAFLRPIVRRRYFVPAAPPALATAVGGSW